MKPSNLKMMVVLLLLIPANAQASRSMAAPECLIKGIVINEKERSQAGQGISESHTFLYLDIDVRVTQMSYVVPEEREHFSQMKKPFNCTYSKGEVITFQKRDYKPPSSWLPGFIKPSRKSNAGQCISAKTQYMADGNFRGGNWIYDIKTLETSECQ